MIAIRIIATMCMAFSCLIPLNERLMSYRLFGSVWRVFVIVALWVI